MKISVHTFYKRQINLPFSSPIKKQISPIKGDFGRSFRMGSAPSAPALSLSPFATSHFLNPWQLLLVIGQFLVLQQSEVTQLSSWNWNLSAFPKFQSMEFLNIEKVMEKRITEKNAKAGASSLELNTFLLEKNGTIPGSLENLKGHQESSPQLGAETDFTELESLSTTIYDARALNKKPATQLEANQSLPFSLETDVRDLSFIDSVKSVIRKGITQFVDALLSSFGSKAKAQLMDGRENETVINSGSAKALPEDLEKARTEHVDTKSLEFILSALEAIEKADCKCREKAMNMAGPNSFFNSSFMKESEDIAFHQNFISSLGAKLTKAARDLYISKNPQAASFPPAATHGGMYHNHSLHKEYISNVLELFRNFLIVKGNGPYEEHPVIVMSQYGFANVYKERLQFLLSHVKKIIPMKSIKEFFEGTFGYGGEAIINEIQDYKLPHSAKKLIELEFSSTHGTERILRGYNSVPDELFIP